jgi:RNA polymerase sigma-70 factor (ECF subfamily)
VAPLAWLGERDAGDLFLACACVEGVPQALRAFDAAFLQEVDVYLRTLHPPPWIVAETRQLLREKLFVGLPGKPPKIRQYRGRGALRGWVRVTAVRAALNLQEADRAAPGPDEAEALARVVAPDADPELALLRERYKDDFLAALREAMAGLSRRDRGLLRFVFVERLTPARIGEMYGVHRTTAMRWIEAAQGEILAQTRARMMERLRLSPSECDHLFVLVKSRMDITLSALLETGK